MGAEKGSGGEREKKGGGGGGGGGSSNETMHWYRDRRSGSAECIMIGKGRGMEEEEEEEENAVSDDCVLVQRQALG